MHHSRALPGQDDCSVLRHNGYVLLPSALPTLRPLLGGGQQRSMGRCRRRKLGGAEGPESWTAGGQEPFLGEDGVGGNTMGEPSSKHPIGLYLQNRFEDIMIQNSEFQNPNRGPFRESPGYNTNTSSIFGGTYHVPDPGGEPEASC